MSANITTSDAANVPNTKKSRSLVRIAIPSLSFGQKKSRLKKKIKGGLTRKEFQDLFSDDLLNSGRNESA